MCAKAQIPLRRLCDKVRDKSWKSTTQIRLPTFMTFVADFHVRTLSPTFPVYRAFHKKKPLFGLFIIHSNDDQFTHTFYQL